MNEDHEVAETIEDPTLAFTIATFRGSVRGPVVEVSSFHEQSNMLRQTS